MTRTFLHTFDPSTANPASGPTIALTVREIENAGIKEVLQTPGAAFGSWNVLDALLKPTGPGSPFLFREPLGQSREVKVALSGLFGRFIARAYLDRYFGLSIYAHLGRTAITLDGRKQLKIVRTATGDLPDWVACAANLSQLTVAEAKGCHDTAGPESALKRAWYQVKRVDVTAHGRRVTVKRIAIATRWGSASGGAADVRMGVRDPEDEADPIPAHEMDCIYHGLLRHHVASLVGPLGHGELAASLVELATSRASRRRTAAADRARRILEAARPAGSVESTIASGDLLIGGFVTRSGPIPRTELPAEEQRILARLALRPVFIGIERRVIAAAVEDDTSLARLVLVEQLNQGRTEHNDSIGTWVLPIGEDQSQTDDS